MARGTVSQIAPGIIPGKAAAFWRAPDSRAFGLLVVFLVCVWLFGGSARDDVQSLVLLQPLAVLVLGVAVFGLRREALVLFPWVVSLSLTCVIAVIIHLVPLPASWWQSLHGRELPTLIATTLGRSDVSMPLTLVPDGTWHAFYSLLAPCAVAALMIQTGRYWRARVLYILLGLGALSLMLSLIQAAFPTTEAFYPYAISSLYVPVGLFANRNHSAVFAACLASMTATFYWSHAYSALRNPVRAAVAAALSVSIVMVILLTGSRAGLAVLLIAAVTLPLIMAAARRRKGSRQLMAKRGGAIIAALVGVTVIAYWARSSIFDRLSVAEATPELRWAVWDISWELALQYFPYGSGWGSFVQVYQIAEPGRLLTLDYWNHAHNDWLETVMTGGLMGVVLLGIIVGAWTIAGFKLAMRARHQTDVDPIGLCGFLIIGYLGLASFVDYPLRVPSLMSLFVIAAIWLEEAVRRDAISLEREPAIV